jgi:hypothetical protein
MDEVKMLVDEVAVSRLGGSGSCNLPDARQWYSFLAAEFHLRSACVTAGRGMGQVAAVSMHLPPR